MELFKKEPPHIMGVLNVTPDSFYDGGRYHNIDSALQQAERMFKEGADIIDVGGESTRPGAEPVSTDEELSRVIPVIEKLKREIDISISIDTYKAYVAEEALKMGVDMVNDISGLNFDPEMPRVLSRYNPYVVIMHIKGTPRNMQNNPTYNDVVGEITDYFKDSIEIATRAGIASSRLILDPGIGFGKTLKHNVEILRNIDRFKELGFPLLIGHSRKSMISDILGGLPPGDRLEGTLAITAYLTLKGIDIIRVHDVKENKRVIEVIKRLKDGTGIHRNR